MKHSFLYNFLLLLSSHCAFASTGIEQMHVSVPGCFRAGARYEVLMPNAENPISYNVDITQIVAPSDSLMPCRYLIGWNGAGGGDTQGFATYFDGNFFRYHGGRLSEYHAADGVAPFAPDGNAMRGVQRTEMFASLLPVQLQQLMQDMATDTAYTYSVSRGDGGAFEVRGSHSFRGYKSRDFVYRFNSQGLPEFIEIITNPEMQSEQTITATYSYADSTVRCPDIDEAYVAGLYPRIFEKFRRDSFSLEALRGEPLPAFSAPTLTRERYSRARGDAFAVPTVIAVLDSSVDNTDRVVSDLRAAVGSLPFAADLVLAFTDKDAETIESITGPLRQGEFILTSARSLARDCGVADTPAIIFCRTDGTVGDIHIGRNNNLRQIVIQKASLTRN